MSSQHSSSPSSLSTSTQSFPTLQYLWLLSSPPQLPCCFMRLLIIAKQLKKKKKNGHSLLSHNYVRSFQHQIQHHDHDIPCRFRFGFNLKAFQLLRSFFQLLYVTGFQNMNIIALNISKTPSFMNKPHPITCHHGNMWKNYFSKKHDHHARKFHVHCLRTHHQHLNA